MAVIFDKHVRALQEERNIAYIITLNTVDMNFSERSRTSRSNKYRLGRCRRRWRVYKNGKGKKERKREILHPQYINQHGGSVYAFVCV